MSLNGWRNKQLEFEVSGDVGRLELEFELQLVITRRQHRVRRRIDIVVITNIEEHGCFLVSIEE